MRIPTERFSDRVENYVKYRPGYPPGVLRLFHDAMNLTKESVVADIGSGTGISSKMFLENGNTVFGVEPNRLMRDASKEFLRDFSGFCAIDGTAENTTLETRSIDIIVAAQAFHWFDQEMAVREFRRILRGECFIALIWNERQVDTTEFLLEYERFLLKFGTDYQKVRHEQVTGEVIRTVFGTHFREAVFPNTQTFEFEGLKGRVLSSSYMPSKEHPLFPEMIKELQLLFANHQKNDTIEIHYDTKVFYGKF